MSDTSSIKTINMPESELKSQVSPNTPDYEPHTPDVSPPQSPKYNPHTPDVSPPQSPKYDPNTPEYTPETLEVFPPPLFDIFPRATKKDKRELEKIRNEYNEIVNNYYILKDRYDSVNQEERKTIISKPISWNEKRKEFKNSHYKCINCRRPVGSNFKRYEEIMYVDSDNMKIVDIEIVKKKYNSKNIKIHGKILKASCGDTSDPCILNIQIFSPDVYTFPEQLDYLEKKLSQLKIQIIFNKNNFIFGYNDENKTLDIYDSLKPNIVNCMNLIESTLENYMNIVQNVEIENEYIKTKKEYYLQIENYKTSIQEFEKTNNNEYIVNAVDIYLSQIIPICRKLNDLIFKHKQVEYNEDDNTYHLIETKHTIESISCINTLSIYDVDYSPFILSNIYGVDIEKEQQKKEEKQAKREIKKRKKELKEKNKTRKLNEKIKIIPGTEAIEDQGKPFEKIKMNINLEKKQKNKTFKIMVDDEDKEENEVEEEFQPNNVNNPLLNELVEFEPEVSLDDGEEIELEIEE
jgi:hypothetical protein